MFLLFPLPLPRLMRGCAAALFALAGCGVAQAQIFAVSCPMRVQSLGAKLAEDPGTGFRMAFHGGSLAYLTGVTMFEGAPQDGHEVAPEVEFGIQTWQLQGLKNPPVIVCRYEGGIGLGRQLHSRLRQCSSSVVRGRPDAAAMALPQRTVIRCE